MLSLVASEQGNKLFYTDCVVGNKKIYTRVVYPIQTGYVTKWKGKLLSFKKGTNNCSCIVENKNYTRVVSPIQTRQVTKRLGQLLSLKKGTNNCSCIVENKKYKQELLPLSKQGRSLKGRASCFPEQGNKLCKTAVAL